VQLLCFASEVPSCVVSGAGVGGDAQRLPLYETFSGAANPEWIEVLKRDWNHRCIVSWVRFNESWGVPDLPDSPAQSHYVQALYHLTKTLDPTRPVIGNDGGETWRPT
jgi:hypothetical protein